jgi:hypothetical protein
MTDLEEILRWYEGNYKVPVMAKHRVDTARQEIAAMRARIPELEMALRDTQKRKEEWHAAWHERNREALTAEAQAASLESALRAMRLAYCASTLTEANRLDEQERARMQASVALAQRAAK